MKTEIQKYDLVHLAKDCLRKKIIFRQREFFNEIKWPREPGRYELIVHQDIFIQLKEYYDYDEFRSPMHRMHKEYLEDWKFYRKDTYLKHYIYQRNEDVNLYIDEYSELYPTIRIEIKEKENNKPVTFTIEEHGLTYTVNSKK